MVHVGLHGTLNCCHHNHTSLDQRWSLRHTPRDSDRNRGSSATLVLLVLAATWIHHLPINTSDLVIVLLIAHHCLLTLLHQNGQQPSFSSSWVLPKSTYCDKMVGSRNSGARTGGSCYATAGKNDYGAPFSVRYLDRGGWSVSCPGCFTSQRKSPL